MKNKPIILDKRTSYIYNCTFGQNVIIHPCVKLTNCQFGDNVEIFSFCEMRDSVVEEGTKITHSYIEGAHIGKENEIGPFTRLRKGAVTESKVKLGNFVEVKNSHLYSGVKAGHLAYIGDADIGENTNIGCGAIFVNYNGKIKQRSSVGKDSFIGSNVNVIAPCNIAEGSYICAGTTVTDDTEKDDFVIGRVKPTIKSGRAIKYRKEEK